LTSHLGFQLDQAYNETAVAQRELELPKLLPARVLGKQTLRKVDVSRFQGFSVDHDIARLEIAVNHPGVIDVLRGVDGALDNAMPSFPRDRYLRLDTKIGEVESVDVFYQDAPTVKYS